MDYKIWFNQALPKAVNRTLNIGFPKSGRLIFKPGVASNRPRNEIFKELGDINSRSELFADPMLHQALDRLMARMRLQ